MTPYHSGMTQNFTAAQESHSGAAADAVVIGAGVIGSAVAFELAKRGLSVIVVDKLPAAGYGSTSASSAIIRFHYSTEAGVALAWEAKHCWDAWAEHVRADTVEHEALAEFVLSPVVMFLADDEPQPAFVTHFDTMDIPYRLLPIDDLASWPVNIDPRRFGPAARLDTPSDADHPFWGEPTRRFDRALYMEGSGYISDPQLAAQNLATAAGVAGARFQFRTEVVSIDRTADGSRVSGVTLGDGTTIAAPVVVNVAGPHALAINRMAGVEGDMARSSRPLRREVYIGPAPANFDGDHGFIAGDGDVGVYYRPERGDNILIGSQEPDCDELEWVDDADHFDETLTEDEFQLSMMRTSRRFPDLAIPHSKRGLVALYDASPDWTPLYDRSQLDGFYMACGSSGNQFKNAPVAGHLMAELITAVESGHDHDAQPLVVTGAHTGLDIDMSTFSRRKAVDPNAAHNVLG